MRPNHSSGYSTNDINIRMSNNGSQTPHTVSTKASARANTHTQQMLGNHICQPSNSVFECDGEDRQRPIINSLVLFSSMNSINTSINGNNNNHSDNDKKQP